MRSRLLLTLALALGLGASACGVPRDDHPRPLADDRVPFELLDPTPATTAVVATTAPPR